MITLTASLTRRHMLVTAGAIGAFAVQNVRAEVSRDLGLTPADRLRTYMRLRSSVDGRITFGWLDAERSTVVDGEIRPFCRMLAASLGRVRRLSGELYELNDYEVCFYLDSKSGELLTHFLMPGARETVEVPIYTGGPALVRFASMLDEWEENIPGKTGSADAAIAPRGRVHLERNIADLHQVGDLGYLRANEFGRVYPDPGKPPAIFYREWMVWSAPMADIRSDEPSIVSRHSYSAMSSWRPWMKMGDVRGHTTENGFGGKVAALAALPDELRNLLREHHPEFLDRPDELMRWPHK